MRKNTYTVNFENNPTHTELELDSCKELFISRPRWYVDKNDAYLIEIEIGFT